MFAVTADLTKQIIAAIKAQGLLPVGPQKIHGVGTISVLGRGGKYVGVLGPVQLSATVDDTFKKIQAALKDIATTHGHFPQEIFVQSGGNIPIPDWFRRWCEENGIRLTTLDTETILRGEIRLSQ